MTKKNSLPRIKLFKIQKKLIGHNKGIFVVKDSNIVPCTEQESGVKYRLVKKADEDFSYTGFGKTQTSAQDKPKKTAKTKKTSAASSKGGWHGKSRKDVLAIYREMIKTRKEKKGSDFHLTTEQNQKAYKVMIELINDGKMRASKENIRTFVNKIKITGSKKK